MRATVALVSKIAALSLTLAYGSAWAQDVAPETPPELRDFRLDPQPERPAAQPTVEPAPVTPPPAVPTVPETGTPTPRTQAPVTTPARRPAPIEADVSPTSGTPTGDAAIVAPTVDAEPVPVDDVIAGAPEPSTQPTEQGAAWWQIAAALGLIVAMLAALYRYMRSRKRAVQPQAAVVERSVPAQVPRAPIPASPSPRPASPAAQTKSKPRVAIDFIPAKASLSFTALTIKGELRVVNESGQAVTDLQLRAGIISASAHQDAEIAAFHRQALQMPAKPLGDAGAGERIGVAIELSVPLADLQSFPLGDQQLFVPLMVANIAYRGDEGSSEVAQIACMIGREANPPKPKMAPLRLDLGPRSFSPLGQRPVLT